MRSLLVGALLLLPTLAIAQTQPQPSSCEMVRGNFAAQIGVQATQLLEMEKLVLECRQNLATEKAKNEKETKDAPKPTK